MAWFQEGSDCTSPQVSKTVCLLLRVRFGQGSGAIQLGAEESGRGEEVNGWLTCALDAGLWIHWGTRRFCLIFFFLQQGLAKSHLLTACFIQFSENDYAFSSSLKEALQACQTRRVYNSQLRRVVQPV